jgi:predicted AlkP superfamily pyrophosphatase or phosphodiesterase
MNRILILAFWLAGWPAWAADHHVVIISLDGCRPEFYLPGELSRNCPTLTGLRDRGSYARGAMPPYPSLTYPGHATIATGVSPARHGITANNVFDPPKTDGRGFWYASDVKAPALWDAAHAAGLTVGSVSWPCNAGSKAIAWNIPEFWTTAQGKELDLMQRFASPGLWDAIGGLTAERLSANRDEFLAACAIHILREHQPNLMFIHLLETDKVQHKGGRDAAELPAALRRVDAHVKTFLETVKAAGLEDRTTFIVLGDHGFADVRQVIAPNWLLATNGLLSATGWRAMVMNTGGSAGVYLKDPNDAATAKQVRSLLEKHAAGLYRIIDRDALTKLGGPRDAAFYLEAEPGYMFSGALTGQTLVRTATLKGNHGFLPTNPQLHTGFLAAGRGIRQGVVLETIRLADVAPTVARLLGVKLEGAEGRVLEEILASGG